MKDVVKESIRTFFKLHAARLILACLVILASSLLQMLLPLSIGHFYAITFEQSGAKGALLQHLFGYFSSPLHFLWMFAGLILLRALAGFVEKWLVTDLGEVLSAHLRLEAFNALLFTSETLRQPTSKWLRKIPSDLRWVRDYYVKGYIYAAADAAFIFLACIFLYAVSPILASVWIPMVLVGFAISFILSRTLARGAKKSSNAKARLSDFLTEWLPKLPAIQALNKERSVKKSFIRLNKAEKHVHYADAWSEALIPVVFYGSIALVLFTVIQQPKGSLPGSETIVFILFTLYLQRTLRRVLRLPLVWKKGKSALSEMQKLISFKRYAEQITSPQHSPQALHLWNTHTNQQLILTRPGLFCLEVDNTPEWLFFLMDVERKDGFQLSDDRLLHDAHEPRSWRKHITIVSPQALLPANTIAEMVCFDPKKTEAGKVDAILSSFPILDNCKADTALDQLSEIQIQVLQLARAAITGKPIIIVEWTENFPMRGADTHFSKFLQTMAADHLIIVVTLQPPSVLSFRQIFRL
jgi:ABC-type multidrug transport system fused ATPase/permease subunit